MLGKRSQVNERHAVYGVAIFAILLGSAASAQRWTDAVSRVEEASLTQTLIRDLRAESWLEATEIADRYRGAPTSAFSQYQAFAYAMTGRLDLVSELQREGQIPGPEHCSDASGLVYRDALETIIEMAAEHRAVILQEFHWDAEQRLLLHELLPRLRAEGFSYFAAEDFEGSPEQYAAADYPGDAPGFHSTREPVFADAVRKAVALGYRLVPYEASFPPPAQIEPQNIQGYRSDQQARNLYQRIFSGDPAARAIIYTGVGWAREVPDPRFVGDVPMVARLKELSGIDPLTIDQTMCHHFLEGAAPVIAFGPDGDAAVQGFPRGMFDLQVRYAPPSYAELNRASWLSRLGRRPVAIPESIRRSGRRVVIEAHLSGEPADASPIDRIYLGADERMPLMLPRGEFEISSRPGNGESVRVVVD